MNDQGIMFSTPMVLALHGRRKTQTRRLATSPLAKAETGTRFWVKETFIVQEIQRRQVMEGDQSVERHHICIDMVADGARTWVDARADSLPKILKRVRETAAGERAHAPAMLMPRIASRMTLIIQEVRVERLHAISDDDAIAEGIEPCPYPNVFSWRDYGREDGYLTDPLASYASLWRSLHREEGQRWEDNPEVAVFTFEARRCNISLVER